MCLFLAFNLMFLLIVELCFIAIRLHKLGQRFKFLVSLNFVAQIVKDVKQEVNGDE